MGWRPVGFWLLYVNSAAALRFVQRTLVPTWYWQFLPVTCLMVDYAGCYSPALRFYRLQLLVLSWRLITPVPGTDSGGHLGYMRLMPQKPVST